MACRVMSSSLAIVLIMFASMTVPAGATALLYTDRAGWEAATSGLTTISFEGFATPSVPGNFMNAAGLTLNGVNFVGLTPPASYYLFTQDPGAATYFSWGSGDVLLGPTAAWGDGYIQANLPAGTTSVGADLMTHTPYTASIVIRLSTDETFIVETRNYPERAFVGFTSNVPISHIQFNPDAGYQMIDNFSYGTVTSQDPPVETLELVTILLGGTGLLFLVFAKGLRRFT